MTTTAKPLLKKLNQIDEQMARFPAIFKTEERGVKIAKYHPKEDAENCLISRLLSLIPFTISDQENQFELMFDREKNGHFSVGYISPDGIGLFFRTSSSFVEALTDVFLSVLKDGDIYLGE